MTIRKRGSQTSGTVPNKTLYQSSFIRQVHQILAAGYARLQVRDLRLKEETEITGLLVRELRGVVEDRRVSGPLWRYEIHEDPPLNVFAREGKRRPRVDIEIHCVQRGPRPTFSFEAKRLNRTSGVAEYLGPNGLGRFLSGQYAADQTDAGMLGYVQTNTTAHWAAQVEIALRAKPATFQADAKCIWKKRDAPKELDESYRSSHVRKGEDLTIHHTFIRCF